VQRILWGVAILFLASLAWKYRAQLTEFAQQAPAPKPIVFDNGTVREIGAVPPALAGSSARAMEQSLPNGVMRRCVRGKETTYTDVACPPGFKEKTVDKSRVTVVPGSQMVIDQAAAPSK
jgi:hypothetical protein